MLELYQKVNLYDILYVDNEEEEEGLGLDDYEGGGGEDPLTLISYSLSSQLSLIM